MADEGKMYTWMELTTGGYTNKYPYNSGAKDFDFAPSTPAIVSGFIATTQTWTQIDLTDLADEGGPCIFQNTSTSGTVSIGLSTDDGSTVTEIMEIPPELTIPWFMPDAVASTDGTNSSPGSLWYKGDANTPNLAYFLHGGAS